MGPKMLIVPALHEPEHTADSKRNRHQHTDSAEEPGSRVPGANRRLRAGAQFDDRRAIAVLPFDNFSGDPEQEFLADGITEDIISMLAGWRTFPVIARNSTVTYKGHTVDIKKVGQELGALYVLEGSVWKSGHRVRVTAQLTRADTNHHIMAERYDRELIDVFELQDAIVTAIAGAIEPELLKFERERIAERPPHSEDAYKLYQRGMFHHYRQTKPDNAEAQEFFRRALKLDPEYPQATAALSITLCSAALVGWSENDDKCFEKAHDFAQRAVTLDPRYPNARFALGLVCMWTSRPEPQRRAIGTPDRHAHAYSQANRQCGYWPRSEAGWGRRPPGASSQAPQ